MGTCQTHTPQQMYMSRLSLLSVVKWIKQMVPQPILLPPGAVIIEPARKSSLRSSLDKSTKTRTRAAYSRLFHLQT